MSLHLSTTSAFQSVLRKFSFEQGDLPFPEKFAIKRFQKKFQEPDPTKTKHLQQKCWDDWLEYDHDLSRVKTSGFVRFPILYKAREALKQLSRVRLDSYDLPKGSEFFATLGQNSIESRLQRSRWSCTYDNFELFAQFVYSCKAMKRAFRHRYQRWYRQRNYIESINFSDKYIYQRVKSFDPSCDPSWEAFKFKLSCITEFVQGSRFSSVYKNNEVRRPINIEPFGNIVVQRQIGTWLIGELKRLFDIDLDVLANTHRVKIRLAGYATIDLRNASDSITIALCKFLLPSHVFKFLMKARSEFILGLDQAYHPVNKISSMGNGFTFELMTIILVAVARQLDPTATVFGDDIIIGNEFAKELIDVLEGVGFQVNVEKSFINSPFRESCGANYHDDFGYIESYDFKWPEHIHDCVVIYNKALRLSRLYPSFERLRLQLRRHIPAALQGVQEDNFFIREITPSCRATDTPPELSNFFRVRPHNHFVARRRNGFDHKLVTYADRYCYSKEDLKIFTGITYRERVRSHTLKHLKPKRHYGKYEMYLHAGLKAKDVLSGHGDWVECLYMSVAGSTMRWTDSALL